MANELAGKRIAFLATDGVEQSELAVPLNAALDAGAQVELLSVKQGQIQGYQHADKGKTFPVTKVVDAARASDYDALMIPGGVRNPDVMRMNANAVEFTRDFFTAGKPVAVICHGPWMLGEADVVRGRTLTSWPSLRTDIVNAGGHWVDEQVVVDRGLVTSRKPDDLPAFCRKMIEEFREGVHPEQKEAVGAASR